MKKKIVGLLLTTIIDTSFVGFNSASVSINELDSSNSNYTSTLLKFNIERLTIFLFNLSTIAPAKVVRSTVGRKFNSTNKTNNRLATCNLIDNPRNRL